MTRTLPVAVLALASLLGSTAQAIDYKVGFVNVPKVLEDAPQAEAARARIEKEFAPRDKDLVAMQKENRAMEDKLLRDGTTMSERERNRVEQEILSRQRDVKRKQDEFREDLNLRRNQELAVIQRVVLEVIQALAKEEKFDLILNSDGLVYGSERVDISDKVIQRLQEEFKKSGGK